MWRPAIMAAILMLLSAGVRAETVVVYGAGSLRESIGEIAQAFAQAQASR
jgi:ABC-type molybdate transport system substrate-binding protein